MRFLRLLPLSLPALLLLQCAPLESSESTNLGEVALDAKADGATLTRKLANLGVTLDPYATLVTFDDGGRGYRLTGKTSKNLDAVFAFVPDDAFAEARTTGKRTFAIDVRQGHELNTLLSGLPLFVTLDPASGSTVTAAIWFTPRYLGFSGSSAIVIDSRIKPIWSGGDVLYRGAAELKGSYTHLEASTDDDLTPHIVATSKRRFRIDLTYRELELAADPPNDPIFFHAFNADGASVHKQARIGVAVGRFELTSEDAYAAWPNDCRATTQSCIDTSLAAGTLDLETCGSYRQVLACGPIAIADEPSLDQVAADFRAALVGWYADHGADVASAGGNTLAAAQAAVSTALLQRVLSPVDDPNAHDLSRVWIFRHPDVAYPGSDTAWFLAYDKQTGKLVEVYDFN